MKVSVIVPIFNASNSLYSCIRSVMNQTYEDLEIVLVDDASTDNSLQIAQMLRGKDPRIKIVVKEKNEKALKAREAGLRQANSDFVIFFDADDFLPVTAVQNMVRAQQNSDSDVVLGSYYSYYDRFRLIRSNSSNLVNGKSIRGDFEGEELIKRFGRAFFGIHSIPVTSWGKLFRKELFADFLATDIPAIHAFDDSFMNLMVFSNVRKITFIEDAVYGYRYGGVTSKVRFETLDEFIELHKLRKKILLQHPDDQAYRASMKEFENTLFQYLYNLVNIKKIKYEDYEKLILKFRSNSAYSDLEKYYMGYPSENNNIFLSLLFTDHIATYQYLIEKSDYKLIKRRILRFVGRILRYI